ncbi:hypothetical protein DY000_02018029 [Brassica cretica]|uniref:Uncharacterized protein n=1 Tax=Brassica cretica TaxID=69181 RepID=A0ABQ7CR86_BRACR|nr:hypothetical protein DY000_02018029 [Brassica cretica]
MWNFINNWNLSKFDTCQREDGNDDPWGSGEWEFYVAETKEPEKDLTNKVFNQPSLETGNKKEVSYHLFSDRCTIWTAYGFHKYYPTAICRGSADRPKGVVPLFIPEDENFKTSATSVHEETLELNVMKIDFGGVRQPNRSNEPTRTSDDLALPGILIDVQFLQRANITGRKHRLILCNSFKRSTALSGAFKPSLALELD